MRCLMLGSVLGLASACVVYDEELVYEDEVLGDTGADPERDGPRGGGGDEDDEEVDDPSDDPPAGEVPPKSAQFDPSAASPGEVLIASLSFDVPLESPVASFHFFGPSNIEALAWRDEGNGLVLVTLSVPEAAGLGANDVLVEFEDGDRTFLEDAFSVE